MPLDAVRNMWVFSTRSRQGLVAMQRWEGMQQDGVTYRACTQHRAPAKVGWQLSPRSCTGWEQQLLWMPLC